MLDILTYTLGALSYSIYVNASGKDNTDCGSITAPCRSLSFRINNVSRNNNTIFLIASPIKQIRYTLENTIIIKQSLTITKFPAYSQNPVMTYHLNLTSNLEEIYAFAISRNVIIPEILTLNIKSVNFEVNDLRTLSERFQSLKKNVVDEDKSSFPLSLSIVDSNISSPCHAINLSSILGYENVSVHMKNLVIENGDFSFKSKTGICKPMVHIESVIEISNVTFCNTENTVLTISGCFNVSIDKLTIRNITWKKQALFTFSGSVLNTKNVLIENILDDNSSKYYKSKKKALFLIYNSIAQIQNMLIKDSIEESIIRPQKFLAIIIVQSSAVKILHMLMIGNSFRNLAQVNKSSLSVKNMTLSQNTFKGTLCSAEDSNLKLFEIKFIRNDLKKELLFMTSSSSAITRITNLLKIIFHLRYFLL